MDTSLMIVMIIQTTRMQTRIVAITRRVITNRYKSKTKEQPRRVIAMENPKYRFPSISMMQGKVLPTKNSNPKIPSSNNPMTNYAMRNLTKPRIKVVKVGAKEIQTR